MNTTLIITKTLNRTFDEATDQEIVDHLRQMVDDDPDALLSLLFTDASIEVRRS